MCPHTLRISKWWNGKYVINILIYIYWTDTHCLMPTCLWHRFFYCEEYTVVLFPCEVESWSHTLTTTRQSSLTICSRRLTSETVSRLLTKMSFSGLCTVVEKGLQFSPFKIKKRQRGVTLCKLLDWIGDLVSWSCQIRVMIDVYSKAYLWEGSPSLQAHCWQKGVALYKHIAGVGRGMLPLASETRRVQLQLLRRGSSLGNENELNGTYWLR